MLYVGICSVGIATVKIGTVEIKKQVANQMVHHILYIAAYYCDQLTMTMTTMFIDYYVFISFFYT